MRFEHTQYNVGFLLGIKAFTAAVLGGIGNLRGALIGGLVLGLIENYGAASSAPQWLDVVAFSCWSLVLMFRPTGILGESAAAGPGMSALERPACAAGRRRAGSASGSRAAWCGPLALAAWRRWAVYLPLIVGAFLLPAPRHRLVHDARTSDWPSVLFYPIGIYVLLALGLNVVVGQAGLLDLGYVAFFAIGGYTLAVLAHQARLDASGRSLPVGIIVAAAAGVILGAPTLRLRGDYLAIVTLGFGEIIRITANNLDYTGGPRGISPIPHPPDRSSRSSVSPAAVRRARRQAVLLPAARWSSSW